MPWRTTENWEPDCPLSVHGQPRNFSVSQTLSGATLTAQMAVRFLNFNFNGISRRALLLRLNKLKLRQEMLCCFITVTSLSCQRQSRRPETETQESTEMKSRRPRQQSATAAGCNWQKYKRRTQWLQFDDIKTRDWSRCEKLWWWQIGEAAKYLMCRQCDSNSLPVLPYLLLMLFLPRLMDLMNCDDLSDGPALCQPEGCSNAWWYDPYQSIWMPLPQDADWVSDIFIYCLPVGSENVFHNVSISDMLWGEINVKSLEARMQ